MGIFDMFKKKETVKQMYLYTDEELEQYEKFIKEQFGDYKNIFHEIVSPDIHLDIIVAPPTKKNNYYKLITMGMGAYKMNVPRELKKYQLERAELALFLPPDWDIKSNKEEYYWPIRQLKALARLPLQSNSWLGYGHTISSDSQNTPYAKNTQFCSMLLLNALNNNFEVVQMNFGDGKKINFYQLYPIYKEELMYIHQSGLDSFPIDDANLMPLNMKRENTCSIKKN